MKKRYVIYVILFLLLLAIKFLVSKFTGQEFTWWTTMGIWLGVVLGHEIVDAYLKKQQK